MPNLKKKEKLDTVLFARITKTNKEYLIKQQKKLNYKSLADFVNDTITQIREKVS